MNPNDQRPTDEAMLDAVRMLGGKNVEYAPGEKEEALKAEHRALSGGRYRPRRPNRQTLDDKFYGPMPEKDKNGV